MRIFFPRGVEALGSDMSGKALETFQRLRSENERLAWENCELHHVVDLYVASIGEKEERDE